MICYPCAHDRHDECTYCPCQHRDPATVVIAQPVKKEET